MTKLIRHLGRFLILASSLLTSRAVAAPAGPMAWPPRGAYPCGASALFALCDLEGVGAGIDEIDAMLGESPPSGHTMARLAEVSSRLGLELRGLRLGAGDWPLEGPALAHIDRGGVGHYVVIRPVSTSPGFVQIIDPPRDPRLIEFDRLVKSPWWTGIALTQPPRRHGLVGCSYLTALVVAALAVLGERSPGFGIKAPGPRPTGQA